MNFWRTFGIHTVSAIETILDKPSYTLEELLEEDEVLQECRSENAKLLNFLTLPSTLEKLFEYITVEPPANADSVRKFKYPFISCEILCCDVWSLVEAVYQHENLIDQMYGFLEAPAPLNPALAAHVSKVAGSLLEKKPGATLAYLRERPNMVDHFVTHLSSSAVMDLLLKIVSCDEEGGGTLEWLCANDLISKLVAKFDKSNPADVHEHAAHALADIIQVSVLNKASPLMAKLESKEVVETLLQHMFESSFSGGKSSSALYHGLDVMTELVKRHVLDVMDTTESLEDCPASLQVIIARLPQLQELLMLEGPARATSLGERVPLGFTRLKVVQFCVPLFFTNRQCVDESLANSELLGVILQLFFHYEWNNFLHQLVESLVASLFDSSSGVALPRAAVEKFHLPARLVQASIASEKRFAEGGLRAGNHAFLMLLAENIADACERDPTLGEIVIKEEGWSNFVSVTMKEYRQQAGMGDETDSDSDRDSDDMTGPPPEPGFQFGGWQDASDSSEEGEGSTEEDGGGDLDDAARHALDELRLLALNAQKAQEEEASGLGVVVEMEASNEPQEEKTEEKTEEEAKKEEKTEEEAEKKEEEEKKEEKEEKKEEEGKEEKKEEEEKKDEEEKTEEEAQKQEEKTEDPVTPPAALKRHDTGAPFAAPNRFEETGNNYGTPTPDHRMNTTSDAQE